MGKEYRYEFPKGKYIPKQDPTIETINWYIEGDTSVYITNVRHPELEENFDVTMIEQEAPPIPAYLEKNSKIKAQKPIPEPEEDEELEVPEPDTEEDDEEENDEPDEIDEDESDDDEPDEPDTTPNKTPTLDELKSMYRSELEQYATDNGIDNPSSYSNKTKLAEAILEAIGE